MTERSSARIYVLEKQPAFQAMLESSLVSGEISVDGFSDHQECLEKFATRLCDLLVVDLEGCESGGLEVIEQARRVAPWVPTLAIVEPAAVSCAIQAIRAGAHDCLDKPVPQDRLLTAVTVQLARLDTSRRRRHRALTPMEIHILQMILAGRTSYEIADTLHRSKRTIDVHRKNIMRKLRATSLVDLIKRALGMGFADLPQPMLTDPELDEGPCRETPNGQYHIGEGSRNGNLCAGDPAPGPAEGETAAPRKREPHPEEGEGPRVG